MMRSLYSAISGLKNHQTKMDVIGNNIANVNTTGFKRSTVTFATALSQTLRGASSPTATQGGSNAVQVGLGSMLGSINQNMTQGSPQSTGNPTDMMLSGSGFFVLDNNGQQVFTRAGGFGQDSSGNLIDPSTGAKVQGYSWGANDTTTPVWGQSGDIKFKKGDTLVTDTFYPIPQETNTVTPSGTTGTTIGTNLENVTIDGMTRVSGTPASGQFSYDPTTGNLTFASDISTTNALTYRYVDLAGTGTNTSTAINVSAGDNTAIVDYPPVSGATVYNGTTAYKLSTSNTPGDLEYTITPVNGKYKITFGTDGTTPTPAATVASSTISYDFTNKAHTLSSFSIDQSGVITGVYSNGGKDSVTHKIAQIEVASFANDAGLENIGGSFYTQTNNSGTPSIGAAGDSGRATITSGELEMSNVDLSQEMTDMITAQRGFQANSRVITVSDTLLQELVDLKRQ